MSEYKFVWVVYSKSGHLSRIFVKESDARYYAKLRGLNEIAYELVY